MTEADLLFERFCADRGVAIRRIPEGPRRTPDFEVWVGRLRIIVEVKQPNREGPLRPGRPPGAWSPP